MNSLPDVSGWPTRSLCRRTSLAMPSYTTSRGTTVYWLNVRVKLILIFLAALGLLACPSIVMAGYLGPSDYDECILESMKGVGSDKAASLIEKSCLSKFPTESEKQEATRELSQDEISLLAASVVPIANGIYFRLFNNNNNIKVKEIVLELAAHFDGQVNSDTYQIPLNVEPGDAEGRFLYMTSPIDEGASFYWEVISALGY